jgi:hypothetical protein
LSWKGGKAVFVVSVDRIEAAEKLLETKGFQTLDAGALSAMEPVHYRSSEGER